MYFRTNIVPPEQPLDKIHIPDLISLKNNILTSLITSPEKFFDQLQSTSIIGSTEVNPDICLYINKENKNIKPLGVRGKIGVPYLLTIQNKQYILKSSAAKTIVHKSQDPPTLLKSLLDQETSMISCEFPPLNHISFYIGLDEFTNEVLISYIIDHMMKKINLSTYLLHYLGYKCSNIGYNLMEYADLGTLDQIGTNARWNSYLDTIEDSKRIKGPILLGILKQLIITLDYLQKNLHFIHGDGKSANIFVSSTPFSFDAFGIHFTAPFTCKIGDFGKSSLTFNRFRLFNYNWLASTYLYVSPFLPSITNDTYTVSNLNSVQIYTRLRHMGFPYYLSFDTYTFIVSLLLDPIFFHTFFESPALSEIWDILWYPSDQALMYSRLLNGIDSSTNSFTFVISLLKNVTLKCHVTSLLFDHLFVKES